MKTEQNMITQLSERQKRASSHNFKVIKLVEKNKVNFSRNIDAYKTRLSEKEKKQLKQIVSAYHRILKEKSSTI